MEKAYLKHILSLLDNYEIQGIDFERALEDVYAQLRQESRHAPAKSEVRADLQAIIDTSLMKRLTRGYDVTPNATAFAHAAMRSTLEDLALLACIVSDHNAQPGLIDLLSKPVFPQETLRQLLHPLFYECARECRTFVAANTHGCLTFPQEIREDCMRILNEYQNDKPLVSPTVLCHYLKSIYPASRSNWKNADRSIVPYPYLPEILQLLPRRGIPNNRDESKQLQAFYKDTLFHEFDHRCPICGIDLPHMLIGSHIKPFRDCAHLYEPIDHNNGLLLCRNHDYLFDQGYITFDDAGMLQLSRELALHPDVRTIFQLPKHFCLDASLLSEERRLFLAYHRRHIFRR